MKFSVSNLSLKEAKIEQAAKIIRSIGFDGVEIAPSIYFPQYSLEPLDTFKRIRNVFEQHQLQVSGLQSVLFGIPNLQLLNQHDHEALAVHMKSVIRIANAMGTKIIVFGSPKNRLRGVIELSKAHEIASNFFQILVENLLDQNVRIALEPNAKEYGADYLTNYDEVLELVDLINSPAICAQIDTGCLEMEGYKPTDCVVRRRPEHVHLSRPGLNTIGTYEDYANLTALLKSKNYGGWVTFETLSDLQNSKYLNEISTVLSSLRDQF